MNFRLLEIRNEIDALLRQILDLRTEKWTIIQSSLSGKTNEVPLCFDDTDRTIRRNGGFIRLSKKLYLFIKKL